MSGFYRYGRPGEDTVAHINTGRKLSGKRCLADRFEKDNPQISELCARMSTALCDAPGCDRPICDLHRTRDGKMPNTDFCPDHAKLAIAE